jgi:hypothetical protein
MESRASPSQSGQESRDVGREKQRLFAKLDGRKFSPLDRGIEGRSPDAEQFKRLVDGVSRFCKTVGAGIDGTYAGGSFVRVHDHRSMFAMACLYAAKPPLFAMARLYA